MNFNSLIFWSPRAGHLRPKIDKGLFFPFLFFFVFLANGQKGASKMLKGKVVSGDGEVIGITVQNMATKNATITDFEGNFSIRGKLGDTLVFSAVQFKRKILPISRVLMNSAYVQVPMERFVNKLREVTVSPYGLSGDIRKDLTGLQLKKDVSAEALGLPNADVRIITQSERKLFEADHGKFIYLGLGFAININKILNRLSGRTRKLKRHVAVDEKYTQTLSVQQSVEDSLFLRELGIPKGKIDDFMYFCEVDGEFQRLVAMGDQLRLWEYLVIKSKLYRKNNNLE